MVWNAPTEARGGGLDRQDDPRPRRRRASATATSRSWSAAAPPTRAWWSSSPPSTSPSSPAAASGLFDQPEAVLLGQTYRLADRHRVARPLRPGAADHRRRRCSTSTSGSSSCPTPAGTGCARFLREWKAAVPRDDRTGEPRRRALRAARRARRPLLGPRRPADGEPARHPRPVLLAARRLRVGAAPGPARRRRSRRTGRRAGPGHLVLPQPRPSTSSTTPRAPTRDSTAKPTSCSTRSTSPPSTGPRASSGRSCSSRP